MSPELIAILGVGIALAGLIVPGLRGRGSVLRTYRLGLELTQKQGGLDGQCVDAFRKLVRHAGAPDRQSGGTSSFSTQDG